MAPAKGKGEREVNGHNFFPRLTFGLKTWPQTGRRGRGTDAGFRQFAWRDNWSIRSPGPERNGHRQRAGLNWGCGCQHLTVTAIARTCTFQRPGSAGWPTIFENLPIFPDPLDQTGRIAIAPNRDPEHNAALTRIGSLPGRRFGYAIALPHRSGAREHPSDRSDVRLRRMRTGPTTKRISYPADCATQNLLPDVP